MHASLSGNFCVDQSALVPSQSLNALLLDDSKFDRRRICRMSRATGLPIHIEEAPSISALAKLLDEEQYDVILLDYHLNVGDGLEALELIRQHPRNAQSAIIMVTGVDEPALAGRAISLGCSDLLDKGGLTAQSLKASITSAIRKANAARSGDASAADSSEALSAAVMDRFRELVQLELAGIVRNVRMIRGALDNPGQDLPACLEALEARCVGLWATLGQSIPTQAQ